MNLRDFPFVVQNWQISRLSIIQDSLDKSFSVFKAKAGQVVEEKGKKSNTTSFRLLVK